MKQVSRILKTFLLFCLFNFPGLLSSITSSVLDSSFIHKIGGGEGAGKGGN